METRWQSMCRYLGFGTDDSERLASLAPLLVPELTDVAEGFYDRTREHEEAHAVFVDEAQINRLKTSMVRWLGETLRGPHDEAYYAKAQSIGHVHVRIGLPQRYMVLASHTLGDRLCESEVIANAPDRLLLQASIRRVLELGLTAMLDAYVEDRLSRARRAGANQVAVGIEDKLSDALDLVDVLVLGLDAKGMIRICSSAATRVTGFEREDLVGTDFAELLFDQPARDQIRPQLNLALTGTRVVVDDVPTTTRAGHQRAVLWELVPAPSESATASHVEIWALGRDRTEELESSERSRRTERLATLGTLAAGLAHEIRNPLNGAALHLTYLQRQLHKHRELAKQLDADEAVSVVQGEISRLSRLVSDFLHFARPHALERSAVDVRDVTRRVCTLVLPEANQLGLDLILDFPKAKLPAPVDSGKLEQVLVNLIRNAMEASAGRPHGSIMVRVRRKPSAAVIEVEDDGPGLASPTMPVFDPFFTTKATGSGLGLAIAHRIIADHGGHLGFESEPGKTIFRIELPLASPDSQPGEEER